MCTSPLPQGSRGYTQSRVNYMPKNLAGIHLNTCMTENAHLETDASLASESSGLLEDCCFHLGLYNITDFFHRNSSLKEATGFPLFFLALLINLIGDNFFPYTFCFSNGCCMLHCHLPPSYFSCKPSQVTWLLQ